MLIISSLLTNLKKIKKKFGKMIYDT